MEKKLQTKLATSLLLLRIGPTGIEHVEDHEWVQEGPEHEAGDPDPPR